MSQHPADLKPRGVKAPLYLIPWGAADDGAICPLDTLLRERLETRDPREILDVLASRGTTLEQVAGVFAYGAKKYARENWKTFAWDDSARDEYFGAICRHVLADARGERIDPESGLPHLAHAACGCLIWRWHERRIEAGAASTPPEAPAPETDLEWAISRAREILGDSATVTARRDRAGRRVGWIVSCTSRGELAALEGRYLVLTCEQLRAAIDRMARHVTRSSDSSLYDEVCEACGATDAQPGGLASPCPSPGSRAWAATERPDV